MSSNYRDGKVVADGYLVLVPDTYQAWTNSETHIRGIRIDRFRATKPALKKGEIPVKIKLWFDKEQLKESIPVVEAEVRGFTVTPPELEVEDDSVVPTNS